MKHCKLCRHCAVHYVNRPRGLCWRCYYKPGVAELYPSTSKFAPRGADDFNGSADLPASTTQATPGSPEKVAILCQRAQQRVALFHPLDGTLDPESKTFITAGRTGEQTGLHVDGENKALRMYLMRSQDR